MGVLYYLSWLRAKVIVSLVRFALRFANPFPAAKPDAILDIPSRVAGRTIKANVYNPEGPGGDSPRPVLLNFHGSGFVLPLHGSDDGFCRHIARQTHNTVVLDCAYRLAPEHPFPAALQDVEDVVRYVQSAPELYDAGRLSIGGFSAGGNLALAACQTLPRATFRAVLAFYPPVDIATPAPQRKAPSRGSGAVPRWLSDASDVLYCTHYDAKDPRISPWFGGVENYPQETLVITAEYDNLACAAEELAERARETDGRRVTFKRMPKVGHAFDHNEKDDDIKAKEEAYGLAVEVLRRVEKEPADS